MHTDRELLESRAKLHGSLLLFTQIYYKLRTGRSFDISKPTARESHFISVCRQLMKVFNGEIDLLVINIPPRYGKTELLIHFIAWSLARYPDCEFIYTSYSKTLAARQTETVREILLLKEFRDLFEFGIDKSSSAKSNFKTSAGGCVYSDGTYGTLTGMGGGIKGCDRFGGCLIIDDAHKPREVSSDVIREGVNNWYTNTFLSRRNDGVRTPIIFIGQKLHENDLASKLGELCKKDTTGRKVLLSLAALDEVGNALYPEMHTKAELLQMQDDDPYVFAAQMQQNPQPAGGGIYKAEWFRLFDEEPKIIATFITCDTAETDKDWNDSTVFSLWGVYKIMHGEFDSGLYGVHWIDCWELHIEPAELEQEFMQFYYSALRNGYSPSVAAIEKKSTGVTLVSVLSKIQGLNIIGIDRTRASGSKTARFLEMQKYVAKGHISLNRMAKHTKMCVDHCAKITANNTHRFDDICDTLYDAVKIVLIDESFIKIHVDDNKDKYSEIIKDLVAANRRRNNIRRAR